MVMIRKRNLIITLGILYGSVWIGLPACEMIVPTEEELRLDNPIDHESDSFVEPQTWFIPGTADKDTIAISFSNTSTVTINYMSNANLYQTRIDSGVWSSWSSQSSTTLEYLEEGTYVFEVKSAYDPGEGEPTSVDPIPAKLTLTIAAVPQNSLRLSPLLVEQSPGMSFDLDVIAEDVSNLMAVKAVILYDRTRINAIDVLAGDFLTSTGGNLATYMKINASTGTIEINIGTAAGSPAGVSGTGVIATLHFDIRSPLLPAETNITFLGGLTELRDSSDKIISIIDLVGTTVRIQP